MKRRGVSLIEYFLIGALVTMGAAATMTPYGDNVAELIKNGSPEKNAEHSYTPPPPAKRYANYGDSSVPEYEIAEEYNTTVTPTYSTPTAPSNNSGTPTYTTPPSAPPPTQETTPGNSSGNSSGNNSGNSSGNSSGNNSGNATYTTPTGNITPGTFDCRAPLTLNGLKTILDPNQFNNLGNITEAELNEKRTFTDWTGATRQFPRFIVAYHALDPKIGTSIPFYNESYDSTNVNKLVTRPFIYEFVLDQNILTKDNNLAMYKLYNYTSPFFKTGDQVIYGDYYGIYNPTPSYDPNTGIKFAVNPYWITIVNNCSSDMTGTPWTSPLILDMNGDGKVSSEAGIGVDVNGDGIPDGAAVDGDKMLAMTDMDGDGKITGKEVFGDHTVDPFTGRPIKAANGFIALKEIALSAEKFTGIKCMDGTYADVTKINEALAKFNKGKIGLISGNNVTIVEPLGKVAKINTEYTEVDKHAEDTADIKHKQISNWLDIKNVSHIVHDVWFAIKNTAKKVASAIANALPF